jgi:hypothetical protein
MSARRTDEQIKNGAALLKQADRLVKEGNIREALLAVESARSVDPLNPYLDAYTARLKSVVNSQSQSEEDERQQEQNTIQSHIAKAQQLCLEALYDKALEELSAAFLIDPSSQDLIRMKNEIKQAQESKKDGSQNSVDHEIVARIKSAEDMLGKGQFDDAIQQLTQAFILNPVSDVLLNFEAKHLRTIRRHQERRSGVQAVAA